MAKIDFLESVKDTVEKKPGIAIGKFIVVPVVLGACSAILILASIALGLANFNDTRQLAELNKKSRQASASVDKAKSLSTAKDAAARDIKVLDVYLKRSVSWSAKLRQLQELVPQGVWLTRFSFEEISGVKSSSDKVPDSLLLSGNLIPSEGINFLGALSNFVNMLKENKDFYGDFDDLVLAKSSSQTYKNVPTMGFEIRLPLKIR